MIYDEDNNQNNNYDEYDGYDEYDEYDNINYEMLMEDIRKNDLLMKDLLNDLEERCLEVTNNNENNDLNPNVQYNATDNLEKDFSHSIELLDSFQIHICAYQINTEREKPFLQYILRKYLGSDKLTFLTLNYDESSYKKFVNQTNILDTCFAALDMIYLSYSKDFKKMLEIQYQIYNYKGFIQEGCHFYLFFDCSIFEIASHILSKRNDLWLAHIDEIVNSKNICDVVIDSSIKEFFQRNENLCYLQDNKGEKYQYPIIVYGFNKSWNLKFLLTFGIVKTDGEKGIKYYFEDYTTLLPKIKKSGMVVKGFIRSAIFLEDEDNKYEKNNKIVDYFCIDNHSNQIPITGHFL
jgi:hypothetical protein